MSFETLGDTAYTLTDLAGALTLGVGIGVIGTIVAVWADRIVTRRRDREEGC